MATIERPPWRYSTAEARKDRNIGIMEKYDLGWSRESIAQHYDITPKRVSQIVGSFGESFMVIGPPLVCVVAGCSKLVYARGWCSMHYSRWRRHGSIHGRVRNVGAPVAPETVFAGASTP